MTLISASTAAGSLMVITLKQPIWMGLLTQLTQVCWLSFWLLFCSFFVPITNSDSCWPPLLFIVLSFFLERFLLFKANNNLSSFNGQHSFILATLKSELLVINEKSNTEQCLLYITFKMKNFERGHVKVVRQAQDKSKPETELKIISGANDER